MSKKHNKEVQTEYAGLKDAATIKEFVFALDDFSEKADQKKPD
jgi:hypothetical protein